MGRPQVILLALLASLCAAVGIVIRQRATREVPAEQGVSTAIVATLFQKPSWWAGTMAAVAGYACQALALSKGLVTAGAAAADVLTAVRVAH
jgi:hypothetical protein